MGYSRSSIGFGSPLYRASAAVWNTAPPCLSMACFARATNRRQRLCPDRCQLITPGGTGMPIRLLSAAAYSTYTRSVGSSIGA